MLRFNEYFLMEEKDVLFYVKNKLKYFNQEDNITCKEIGDGNINYVYSTFGPLYSQIKINCGKNIV